MEHLERTIKIGLASLLLAMLMALGGLAVVATTGTGVVTALLPGTQIAAQQVAAVKSTEQAVATPTQQPATNQQSAQAQPNAVLDARGVVRKAGPAVVTVVNTMQATTGGRFGGRGQAVPSQALGSGVIISSDGYIVTNQHVVDGQQSLEVIFADGTKVPATLVGQDAYTDLAVIKVDAKVPAVAQLGNSDALEAGQPVVAIGTALGDYTNTVTEGIVSGLHRQIADGGTSTQDLIQTDAAINHGNSGGPLLDMDGNVIGINTAVVRSTGTMGDVAEGLGFAIPSNTVKTVVDQLMKNGSINHPYLGITYQPITPQVASQYNLSSQQGIYVTSVADGSPAQQADLVADSIITKVDGVDLGSTGSASLPNLLSQHKVGDSVKLTVIPPNSTTTKEITVVLGARPSGQ